MQKTFLDRINLCRAALESVELQIETLNEIAQLVADNIASGKTIYAAGNGGSAAEAMHFSTELSGRYRSNRNALPGIALCSDGTLLTCIGNDFGWDQVFARQLQALAKTDDMFLAISTSGKSGNIIQAAITARHLGLKVIGLLGKGGGDVLPLCDLAIVIESNDTGAIQEAHLVVIHMLCEKLEPEFE